MLTKSSTYPSAVFLQLIQLSPTEGRLPQMPRAMAASAPPCTLRLTSLSSHWCPPTVTNDLPQSLMTFHTDNNQSHTSAFSCALASMDTGNSTAGNNSVTARNQSFSLTFQIKGDDRIVPTYIRKRIGTSPFCFAHVLCSTTSSVMSSALMVQVYCQLIVAENWQNSTRWTFEHYRLPVV